MKLYRMEITMKKKLALMCIMGAAVVGMTACGSKSEDSDVAAVAETEVSSDEETETESEIEWVSDREDYVDIEDIDIDQYLTLCDYKNMTVSAVKPAIDDDAIESYINSYLLTDGKITDRAVETGDTVNIDYEGKKDGEAFTGGTASGYNLTIGSGTFIDGFEDGLIGVMVGDTVDLNLTFPEDYSSTDLAGQDVVFTVTVNYISTSAEYSSLTDDELQNLGFEYESLDELWETGKAAVEESSSETYNTNARQAIINGLKENSEISELPQWLVDEQQQYYIQYLDTMAQYYYGMDFETYITTAANGDYEETQAEILEECQEVVENFLVMEAVARAEGIEVSRDEVNSQAEEEYESYGYESVDEFLKNVGYSTYRMSILQDEVLEKLLDIVEVTPETETE
jgi:trigger factor